MSTAEFTIQPFDPSSVRLSNTMLVLAAPASGKSTFTQNLVKHNRHRYSIGAIQTGSENDRKVWEKIFHPLFVYGSWDVDAQKRIVNRARECQAENEPDYIGNYIINIIDDVINEPKDWKGTMIKYLAQKGTQHCKMMTVICAQYIKNLPNEFRNGCSYYVIGGTWSIEDKKKIYSIIPVNWGGSSEKQSFEIFSKILDTVCGTKFRFLVIDRLASDISQQLFYYDVSPVEEFQFGSKEYREWGDSRYNKDYKEVDVLNF